MNTTFFSRGDVLDFYNLARIHGINFVFKNFKFFAAHRAITKWNRIDCSDSDFWVIPQVHQRWNKIISGDVNKMYEDYVSEKYLKGKNDLEMLSIGCGNSSHEQNFSKHDCFKNVDGIDFSDQQVQKAKRYAKEDGCEKVNYFVIDFEKENLSNKKYDVILFHSSLHHFNDIDFILKQRVLPLLNPNGLLILWEYTGPNRLQWRTSQLNKINSLLKLLPAKFKTLQFSTTLKHKVYRPGLLRMYLSDPTESVQSETLLKNLHKYFEVLEEKQLGGNLVHPLLKGISQNFLHNNEETNVQLQNLFEQEDAFIKQCGLSDFTFGVYYLRKD